MDRNNPYSPPRAPVADARRKPKAKATGSSWGARFLWTTPVAFVVLLSIAMSADSDQLIQTALGALVFAVLAGVIAMCIPVRSKAGYMIPSILIVMVIVYAIAKLA